MSIWKCKWTWSVLTNYPLADTIRGSSVAVSGGHKVSMSSSVQHRTKLRKTLMLVPSKKRPTAAAFLVRSIFNCTGDREDTQVEITSEALYEVLLEINKDVKDLQIIMKPPVVRVPSILALRLDV